MDPILARAQEALDHPEVIEILEKLSAYGLGVFVPHIHDEHGALQPLPDGYLQVEQKLQVSFHHKDEVKIEGKVAVGWVWDKEREQPRVVVQCC
ncbi:MAG: hypothetical protein R2867_22285 [Caldilineaceae bacterium]